MQQLKTADLRGSKVHVRTWAGPTLAIAAAGATTLLYGTGPGITLTTGGVALLVVGALALITTGIILVRRWLTQLETRLNGTADRLEARLTDTTAERRQLAAEEAKCQVSQLAINGTRERLLANAASAEAHLEQRIADATAAIRQEFEETRAVELMQAYETGAMNERNGVHAKSHAAVAELVYLADRRRQPGDPAIVSVKLP